MPRGRSTSDPKATPLAARPARHHARLLQERAPRAGGDLIDGLQGAGSGLPR